MKNIVSVVLLCVLSLPFIGCGMLTDKDRMVIAEIDGEEMRRSDLRKLLRDMTDEERPIIQKHADLLRALNLHLDTQVKSMLSKTLRAEGKLDIPRDVGEKIYFQKKPEFKNIRNMGKSAEMDLTEGQIVSMEAQIEFGIDDEMELLYREAAVQYRVQELVASGAAKVSEEEFAAEYERRKDSYKSFEYIDFIALRFPNQKGAQQEAIKARQRMLDGESFDAVLESYLRVNQQFGMRSAFENNPSKQLFAQFWHNVTGCKKEDILGPLYLPAHDQMRQGANGQVETVKAPAFWIVLQVEEHRPPQQKTLEEAKQDMFMDLLAVQVMKGLREEHGVVVYADALWRPEGYGDQFKDSMIDIPQQP